MITFYYMNQVLSYHTTYKMHTGSLRSNKYFDMNHQKSKLLLNAIQMQVIEVCCNIT